jgi:perosamine synthetase
MKDISNLAREFVDFTRNIYGDGFIPLHRPVFSNDEKKNTLFCIESNFVSSVGKFVDEFEDSFAEFVGAQRAIACVNGTAALHASLIAVGVKQNDQVITQALTFVATSNAIKYCQASPVFIDVDLDTMGMSPIALRNWLSVNTVRNNGKLINKATGQVISACLPMHTFGLPSRIRQLEDICVEYGIILIEDAAEALGSTYNDKYLGTFGKVGTYSFNGNKIITTGGGGMIVTNDNSLADYLKQLTTTSKKPHEYEYYHNEIAFNYRMPNINAALGVSQLDKLPSFIKKKANVKEKYSQFFSNFGIQLVGPIKNGKANNWLNALALNSKEDRDIFLEETNKLGVMTRPIWKLMTELPMYKNCANDGLKNSKWLVNRIVNIPSSAPN